MNGAPIPGLGSLPTSFQGGLPAVSISGGFSSFGRQTTNPQFQNPAMIDPSVGYTWIKGKHSLKFGYEYEHIWMGVFDNNPPYGSFSFAGSYSSPTKVADAYWADFLFGTTSAYTLAAPSSPIFARLSTAPTCRTIGRCLLT